MKRFLAVFTGSPDAMNRWLALPEAERQARTEQGMAAWHQWAADQASSIVDMGGPLGRTKLIGPGGISDIRNAMAAYAVVQADSHESAAALFLNHPHFMLFPGDGVQVMEVMPVPGQAG
jgi:hypothetical protein